jgi:hypothetical protein
MVFSGIEFHVVRVLVGDLFPLPIEDTLSKKFTSFNLHPWCSVLSWWVFYSDWEVHRLMYIAGNILYSVDPYGVNGFFPRVLASALNLTVIGLQALLLFAFLIFW